MEPPFPDLLLLFPAVETPPLRGEPFPGSAGPPPVGAPAEEVSPRNRAVSAGDFSSLVELAACRAGRGPRSQSLPPSLSPFPIPQQSAQAGWRRPPPPSGCCPGSSPSASCSSSVCSWAARPPSWKENFPGPKASSEVDVGEVLHEFEGEAIFQVDWGRKTTSWRLPDFSTFACLEAATALGFLSLAKNNLEVLMKLSNRTRGQNAAPSAKVYPKYPVEPGDPNALICFVDRFSPPVLNITWLKNGEVVSEGVEETGILPSVDFAFRKFSYLPFVPEEGDFYTCRVEHWGLPEPLTVIWPSEEPTPLPDTAENVLCGLGLAFGILGIIVGTVLFFKAMRMTNHNSRNGRSGGL